MRHRLRREGEAILCRETGADRVARLCARCGSSVHGRPLVSGDAHVSISYAKDLVAVAWSWAGPVGIDVELGGYLEWTRLEALLKASGAGIAGRLTEPLELPDIPTAVLSLPQGYVGTVAGQDVSWRLAGPGARADATKS